MQTIDARLQWPGWETVRLLGKGSYGAVYEIQRTVFGHTEKAALKVITIPRDDSEVEELLNDGYDSLSITQRYALFLKKIVEEYSHMAEMKGHPNIVHCDDVYYTQHEDGIGWDVLIKMELLTPLKKKLQGGISEEMVRKIASDISNALVFCESKDLLHRDIKPQNIFVTEDGTYKLGDFGVAKTAAQTVSLGTTAGTYKYMAPEVYYNQPYGAKADVYSLGLTLYYLLNERRLPFLPLPPESVTPVQEENARMERMHGTPLPPPIHGSEELKSIVLKACAFQPDNRCSAKEMQEMLTRIIPVLNTVQIRFLDANHSVISSKTYRVGERIDFPVICDIESDGYRYTAAGWMPEPSHTAEQNADYMIVWKRRKARPKWLPIAAGAGALVLLGVILLSASNLFSRPQTPTPAASATDSLPDPVRATSEANDSSQALSVSGEETSRAKDMGVSDGSADADSISVEPPSPANTEETVTPLPLQEVLLSRLVPSDYSNETQSFLFYDTGRDNEGSWYTNSIGGSLPDTTNWSEYQIDGAYRSFSGIVYLNYENRNDFGTVTRMTVYGDGKLLYTSNVVTKGIAPQRFSIDVSGVQALRVCIYGNEYVRLSDCILSVSEAQKITETQLFEAFSPNLSDYRVIPAASATATSEVLYSGILFKASYAVDGNLTTSWQESVEGDGIGEALTINYGQTQSIDALRLRLGFASYYDTNGRPKTLLFEFSDGTQAQYTFEDQNKDFYLRLTRPVTTNYMKLTILDAYSGSKWSDTCITEVTAYQRGASGETNLPEGNSAFIGFIDPEIIVGQYGVQVGAFAKYDAAVDFAEKIVASENKLGNTVDVIITIRGKFYVTCLGPFSSLNEANYQMNLLNTEDYQSYSIRFESKK